MSEDSFLADDFLRQLMSVGEVDLVVGIPTQDNAHTVGQTVQAIEEAFRQNFARERVVIVNVDAGSRDGTSEAVATAAPYQNQNPRGLTLLRTPHRVTTRYAHGASQGVLYRAMLTAADLLRAKACAIVSATTSNLTAEWIAKLLRPVYQERFDFVAPLYSRPQFDGLLTRNLLYPMSRAVFGQRLREVRPGEFALSGRFIGQCLDPGAWQDDAALDSPETWLALGAISSSDVRCCQSFLGPKTSPSSSGADVVAAVRQSVGTLFWNMESKPAVWMARSGSEPTPTFGPDHELTPQPMRANRKRILEMFRAGAADLSPILRSILSAGTHADIERLTALDDRQFRFPDELWVRALYEFAASYHHEVLERDHLVQALVPLYRGRICSFLLEHQHASPEKMEAACESLCVEFERQKPYLVERWKVTSEVTS